MTDMTDKLITRTTGIALCSFDSQPVRRANAQDQKLPAFNSKKEPNSFQYEIKAVE